MPSFKDSLVVIFPLLYVFSVSAETLTQERQDELSNLLEQDCGSCHGMTRKGGLGPALTVEALKDKPVEYLVTTISEGRPGTPMPPWEGEITRDEAAWLVTRLRRGTADDQ